MSASTSQSRPLAASAASAVSPVLFLVAIAGGCWAVTVERMRGMDMGPGSDLGPLGWFAVVWVTMMTAMMLPSLSPMAVACSRAGRRGQARVIARTVVFAAGYLLPWVAFGVLAYTLLEGVGSLHLGLLAWDRAGRYLAGGVILGAALYRAGRFAEAIRTLEESHRGRGDGGDPQGFAFLALAHHRLGHRAEASRWLDKLGAYRPKETGDLSWDDVEVRILRREA